MRMVWAAIVLLAAWPASAAMCVDVDHLRCVIDGDTIEIGGERIRLANIDAPEIGHAQCDAEHRLALVAKRRVAELLAAGPVRIRRGDPADGRLKDRYGRTLATVEAAGDDIGAVLVEEGLARPWAGRREPWCEH